MKKQLFFILAVFAVVLLSTKPLLAEYTYYNDNSYRKNTRENPDTFDIQASIGIDYVYSDVEIDDIFEDYIPHTFNSYNISLGTRFGKYVGLEAFYQKSNDADRNILGYNVSTNFQAYGIDLTLYGPTQYDNLFALLSLGAGNYNYEASILNFKEDDDCLGIRVGAGLQVDITKHFAIRMQGRLIWLDSESIDHMREFTIGTRIYF